MSRTALPDGSVRFTPDPGHRSKHRLSPLEVGLTLLIALGVGAVGFRGVGWEMGLPIAAVTAVVTLVAVLVWRRTLPSQVSVTVSATELSYRRFGRTSSVRRADARAEVVGLRSSGIGGAAISVPYLVLSDHHGGFLLNLGTWSEQDLAAIAESVPAERRDLAPKELASAQLRERRPGVLPFFMARPNLFAVLAVVVAVALVAGVMAVVAAVASDDSADAGNPAETSAASAPRAQDLSPAAGREQNALFDEAQDLLGEGARWQYAAPEAEDCGPAGAWQRVLTATSDGALALTDVRTELNALAESYDLVLTADASSRTTYGNPESEAELALSVSGGRPLVRSASPCVLPR